MAAIRLIKILTPEEHPSFMGKMPTRRSATHIFFKGGPAICSLGHIIGVSIMMQVVSRTTSMSDLQYRPDHSVALTLAPSCTGTALTPKGKCQRYIGSGGLGGLIEWATTCYNMPDYKQQIQQQRAARNPGHNISNSQL